MFRNHYLDWNQKRIKGIVDFYGHKFFYYKKILDLGSGHADIGGVLYRLGSDTTIVDVRPEHLKIAEKKFPGIKTFKADLDRGWPFQGKNFDLIVNLDLICHLKNYETHLRAVCASTNHLVLETAVCDLDDSNKSIEVIENKSIYDLSINGVGCRPTPAAIERVLRECGMNFRRQDLGKYNCGNYTYDWKSQNNGDSSSDKRRIWFAVKNTSPIQFSTAENKIIQEAVPEKIVHVTPTLASIPQISAEKKFVIVIPSYNNSKWCEKNIESALEQNYDKFRIIFTDDCSSDDTFEKVTRCVKKAPNGYKCTLIKNKARLGALENLYNMILSCDDNEIIVSVDGDDFLANDNVLAKLKDIYSSQDIYITYGQYKNYPDNGIGVASQYPDNIINTNSFRQDRWRASHLRTFYSWLFKMIKKEDLMKDGKFLEMTWDLGFMYPMLEMAGSHSKFVSDILYLYNMTNPISDHVKNVKLQQSLDKYIRSKPKYNRVERKIHKPKIGLLLIATNKYDKFIQPLISTADKFLLNDKADITYYVLSDKNNSINSNRKVQQIHIDHKPFPYASLDRFAHFTNNADKFANEDYLFYMDVDCLFVDKVEEEILGNLVGVRHCGYVNRQGPFENNPKSAIYVDPKRYKIYRAGGFSGGRKDEYLKLSKWCKDIIEKDLNNGIIPLHHDESVINRYFLDNEPDITLSPSFHFPQSNLPHYKTIWGNNNYQPKILLLDKNHEEIRK